MLIAEVGNGHFGNMTKARELIRAAHNSGADLIKAQAFRASGIKSGSMPERFYKDCELRVEDYLELIHYARDLGNDLFYSIFSDGFESISFTQKWHKVAGVQTRDGQATADLDLENVIVSVPSGVVYDHLPRFRKAEVLYVSEYLAQDPELRHIGSLAQWLGRPVGYSDHTVGVKFALEAHRCWGANIIEKHFTLSHNEKWGTKIFRDSVHGATPNEFEELAKAMS